MTRNLTAKDALGIYMKVSALKSIHEIKISDKDFIPIQTVILVLNVADNLSKACPGCKKLADQVQEQAAKISKLWPGKSTRLQLDVINRNIDKLNEFEYAIDKTYGWTSFCLVLVEDLLKKKHPVTMKPVLTITQNWEMCILFGNLIDLHFHFDRGNVVYEWFDLARIMGERWLRIVDPVQGIQLYTDKHPEDAWRRDVRDMVDWLAIGVPMSH